MIGLEYILKLWNIQQDELADKLGIKKQNVNYWVSCKRKIPKKYLPKLSEIFNVPEEDFQKDLTDLNKLKLCDIQENKVHENTQMIGLEYVLKLHNKTQQELAEELGIKQQNIDAWIKGKRKIPDKHLLSLSNLFNAPKEIFQKSIDCEKLNREIITLMIVQ